MVTMSDLTVEPGLETALGAVLGEDLEASLDEEAPRRWTGQDEVSGDPALPDGVRPFAVHIKAPDALARRLRQIGLVEAHEGAALVKKLQVGQRLVSPEGHVWRWDGLVVEAGAPSAACCLCIDLQWVNSLPPVLRTDQVTEPFKN